MSWVEMQRKGAGQRQSRVHSTLISRNIILSLEEPGP